MDICVQEATNEDIASIVSLWERFMAEEEDAVPDADISEARTGWIERLLVQMERRHFLCATQEETSVGFIGAIDSSYRSWIPQRILYITDIYVHPQFRRSNSARLLFDKLQTLAKELGYTELWTNTHHNNRRVQLLLQRRGFASLCGFEIQGLKDQLYYHKPV